ncbi:WhiB family transcriptional regulator [Streptomyces sp. NBC_01497]|uniref:WhiB family transcriptional regulator n=1 Tax=Streptomyces sp. NBC_01497 TaxID=2903885 RepID=UPI002E373365|nr:WhiB family transcriptional regulator [Streptomyces sp. NBC_01497]
MRSTVHRRQRRLAPSIPECHPAIPYPVDDQPTGCRTNPDLFLHDERDTSRRSKEAAAQAVAECAGCPIAAACLKWALVNSHMTQLGIWGGTTAADRERMRDDLRQRFGRDWMNTLARQGSRAPEHTAASGFVNHEASFTSTQ